MESSPSRFGVSGWLLVLMSCVARGFSKYQLSSGILGLVLVGCLFLGLFVTLEAGLSCN